MKKEFYNNLEKVSSLFMRVLTRQVTLRSLSESTEEDMSLSQLQCLCYLSNHSKSRLHEISAALSISSPAATKLISRLIRKGLVQNVPCAKDRRSSEIDLTEQGCCLIMEYHNCKSSKIEETLQRMEVSDRESLLNGMTKFISASLQDENSVQDACLHCGKEHDPNCIINRTHLLTTGKPIS